ncbi:hypothetical protein RDWZM_000585, partial [Blomia tropicalis]
HRFAANGHCGWRPCNIHSQNENGRMKDRKKERQLGPKFADDDDDRIRMQGGRQS